MESIQVWSTVQLYAALSLYGLSEEKTPTMKEKKKKKEKKHMKYLHDKGSRLELAAFVLCSQTDQDKARRVSWSL